MQDLEAPLESSRLMYRSCMKLKTSLAHKMRIYVTLALTNYRYKVIFAFDKQALELVKIVKE